MITHEQLIGQATREQNPPTSIKKVKLLANIKKKTLTHLFHAIFGFIARADCREYSKFDYRKF
jgi:hypothetical protein